MSAVYACRGVARVRLVLAFVACTGTASEARAQVDSANVDALVERGLDALTAKRLDEGITLFKRCLKSSPRYAICAYNLACAYSLKRDGVTAVEWLARAADWGYEDVKHMSEDSDLDNIRDRADYRQVVDDIQARLPDKEPRLAFTPARSDRGLELVAMLRSEMGSGAGIIIGYETNRIYIATADHVVRHGADAQRIEVQIRARSPRWYKARLLPSIATNDLDLAIIAVDGVVGPELEFCSLPLQLGGDSGALRRGGEVYPVGYPGGTLWAMPLAADHVSQVSPSQIGFESQFIRVGFSGGALLNDRGEVVAMLIADEPPLGRAIPLTLILRAARAAGYPVQLTMPDQRARPPLHEASRTGNVTALRRALENCADPHAVADSGRTALHEAAAQGSGEAVRLLLARGARRNAWAAVRSDESAREWGTPLHFAAKNGRVDALKALLGAGSDVDLPTLVRYNDGDIAQAATSLHIAAEHDRADVAEALIAAGANVEEIMLGGGTPLDVAAAHGAMRVARVLVRHGAAVQTDTSWGAKSPLRYAAELGNVELLQLFFGRGIDVNAVGGDLLYRAAEHGQLEAARFLIARKARVDEPGYLQNTPLHIAAENRHGPVVKLLLASGADPNVRNEHDITPIAMAVKSGDLESLQALVDAKADIGNALFIALENRNAAAARILIKGGADVSMWNRDRRQPLHVAAAVGLTETVDLLLKAGAPVSSVSDPQTDGGTPLHAAAENGHAAVVDLLLAAKAPVNARDKSQRTPLYRAVDEHHADVVSRLLEAGADPNVASDYTIMKETPLANAAFSGPAEILALMLASGGDPNHEGVKPLSLAAGQGSAAKVRLLLKAGARLTVEAGKPSALHSAARTTEADSAPAIIALLVAAGAPLEAKDEEERTPLHVAAAEQNVGAVRALLAGGASVRAVDKCGRTPLWVALGTSQYREDLQLAIAQLLVTAGADVNVSSTCGGETILDRVERLGHMRARQFLVSKGAKSKRP